MNENVTLFVKPGEGWGLHFGSWDSPDGFSLCGFETSFDAWAFLFASAGIDVSLPHIKSVSRKWTNKPRERRQKDSQVRMF